MAGRTLAIGDIHGDLDALHALMAKVGVFDEEDTIVFLGDYVDRGPKSAQVIEYVRYELRRQTKARVICLRGNHEDAWLRVIDRGWDAFVVPPGNGALACMRSFTGGPVPELEERPREDEVEKLYDGAFFPPDVVQWMMQLPYWHEDEHAIYVHAGLPQDDDGRFLHPRDVPNKRKLLWLRTEAFFRDYRGKTVVFGHTVTATLPEDMSGYTPEDPTDLWAGEACIGIDTGAGKGGFLTGIEFPDMVVWESRSKEERDLARNHDWANDPRR